MSNGTGDNKEKTKFLLFGGASSEKDWAEDLGLRLAETGSLAGAYRSDEDKDKQIVAHIEN